MEKFLNTPPVAGSCFNPDLISGIVVKGDIGKDTLAIYIPQVYRDYTSDYWDPPSSWDEGITGAIFDYGINLQSVHSSHKKNNMTNASAYGVTGLNIGAWRVRTD